MRRHPTYYLVAGVALDQEMERVRALPVFAAGPLATQAPELKVRRARRRPNRLGFAVPSQYRLSVTAYPGIRPGDVLETLLHELVHLHVGRAPEAHAWHGPTFKRTLARAMREAFGVAGVRPRGTRHGDLRRGDRGGACGWASLSLRARLGLTAKGPAWLVLT